MEIKRNPKDRGFGYKKAYEYDESIKYEESIKKDLEPTEKDWQELKKQLPQFFKDAIEFVIIIGIALIIGAFVIIQIIKLLHIIW